MLVTKMQKLQHELVTWHGNYRRFNKHRITKTTAFFHHLSHPLMPLHRICTCHSTQVRLGLGGLTKHTHTVLQKQSLVSQFNMQKYPVFSLL